MEESSTSNASGKSRDHTEAASEDLDSKLKRAMQELEACKKELLRKERALSGLRKKLGSLKYNERVSEEEAELSRMAAEMERAQEMATMGSWVLDVETGKVTWTPELHRMFGQDPSCPVPSLQEQETWYSKASWEAMNQALARTIQDGCPYNIELETIRRDGSIGILRSIGEAERDESGRIVTLRGVAQDISDIKEAEAKLKLALEQERTAQIYKDQFLANMSHEIRTPLNGVIGFASLLRDADLDPKTRNEYISTIENCSDQLLSLIDDIIDVAKIEAGEIAIENKPFNLARLTHETAVMLEAIKVEKGKSQIKILTRIPVGSEELLINSDRQRIQQILINLLGNALKFSHKGNIDFGFELLDKGVEFFVKDEGIGIEAARKELIFKRFEHIEGTEVKYEGTGLGLSISKGLAELLGASLTVESELGQGSLFRLTLPNKPIEPSNEAQTKLTQKPSIEQTNHCTILVAEDEANNRIYIQRVLESNSVKVLFAHDGAQAISAFKEHSDIDLVLMDIRMPSMNGDEAAKEILNFYPEAKIIAQSAYALREEREDLLKIGFKDYISKPYKAEDLRKIVNKWI